MFWLPLPHCPPGELGEGLSHLWGDFSRSSSWSTRSCKLPFRKVAAIILNISPAFSALPRIPMVVIANTRSILYLAIPWRTRAVPALTTFLGLFFVLPRHKKTLLAPERVSITLPPSKASPSIIVSPGNSGKAFFCLTKAPDAYSRINGLTNKGETRRTRSTKNCDNHGTLPIPSYTGESKKSKVYYQQGDFWPKALEGFLLPPKVHKRLVKYNWLKQAESKVWLCPPTMTFSQIQGPKGVLLPVLMVCRRGRWDEPAIFQA
jgi:hypothetical protein